MNKVKIPNYSFSEEMINSVSHGVGGIFSVVGLIIMLVNVQNKIIFTSYFIYGMSLILLYLISCVYHAIPPYLKLKKIFRVIDHCNVFLLEAGTFTPICLLLIGGVEGFIYFVIIWLITIIGIILNIVNVDKYQMFSLFLHLLIGWSVVLLLKKILVILDIKGIIFLFGGGILYSIGAFLYKIGATKKYMHSVFHFFCLAGSLFHFFLIFLYCK